VYALAFNGDGTRLFVAGYGQNIYTWDVSKLASAQSPKLLTGHQAAVNSLAFNPVYPSIMASTSDDKTLLIWNVDNGESTLPVWGLNESMEAVAFHPKGDELASATNNKTVLLWKWNTDCATSWDRNSCQPSILGTPLIGHDTAVENLIFLSDTRLLSSSEDGQLILWNLDKSFWYQQACTIVNRSLSPAETSQYLEGKIRTRLLKAQSWFSRLFSGRAQEAAPSCLSVDGS
jgi:WD40 repeat protein